MKVISAIFFSMFLTGCGYVQFQRVQYDQKTEKFVSDKNFSKQFQKNVIYVLHFFNEKYYIENDILYIPRKLWRDKETLWNYCNKADDEWIKKIEELTEGRRRKPPDDNR